MSKPIMIEKAKSFSLVVLFLLTVLLLYFFWGNISFKGEAPPRGQLESELPQTIDLIKPDRVVVNFGADNYTVISSGKRNVWRPDEGHSMVKELDRFGQAENISVEEITYAKYWEIMKFRSVRAEFSYDIPISDFCRNFNIKKAQSYDAIEAVSAIGYSTASGQSIFIYDGKNHKYYRLFTDEDRTDFTALIATIESEGYNIYYPLSTYLGVDNNTLVPLAVETNLKGFSFRQDTYSYQTEKINKIAEDFFGGNFDFVRKITEDNGTVIYMYGYGQNVLIVNTDGSIEYKEEQIMDNAEQSYLEALETAVDFVARHGSWESLEGAKLTPYLKDVILNPNKKKGYRFIFGMEVNGSRLYYEEGYPIITDVISGQVTYYKRNMIDFDKGELEAIETYSVEDAFSAVNLIAQNYKNIFDILLQFGVVRIPQDQTAMFEEVASLVNNMQIGYVKPAKGDVTEIRPVWIVTVNDIDVYFDLYSAEPRGYSKQ